MEKSVHGETVAVEEEKVVMNTSSQADQEAHRLPGGSSKDHQNELESTKVKMSKVREENKRLKLLLEQITKDHQSLQMYFFEILHREPKKSAEASAPTQQENEHELVSLSLGRSEPRKEESNSQELNQRSNEGLALGLDWRLMEPSGLTETVKNSSCDNGCGDLKDEEEPDETWRLIKAVKSMRKGEDQEEHLQQTQLKKARVSVKARCDTQTMNDGCQWRKYGQKTAKGNPCPRAYYRCAVSPTCPVRKQVQRCAEDMSTLITTYEGNHNHPLPVSATAMAFTTSAAASVLQSHSSSTSQRGVGFSETAPLSSFNELNFTQNSRSQQFYFPNSSISTANSHPTITLDLTRPSTSSYFNRLVAVPRYSSTCLNFSSSSPSSSSSYIPQASWKSIHNIASFSGANRQPPDKHFYQPYSAQMVLTQAPPPLTETIAAATKAITADPSFRSALFAAVTSLLGNGSTGARESHGGGEASSPNNGVGCLSGYSNGPLSQQEQGSLTLFPASLLVSTPNRGSGSAADSGDHIK